MSYAEILRSRKGLEGVNSGPLHPPHLYSITHGQRNIANLKQKHRTGAFVCASALPDVLKNIHGSEQIFQNAQDLNEGPIQQQMQMPTRTQKTACSTRNVTQV